MSGLLNGPSPFDREPDLDSSRRARKRRRKKVPEALTKRRIKISLRSLSILRDTINLAWRVSPFFSLC